MIQWDYEQYKLNYVYGEFKVLNITERKEDFNIPNRVNTAVVAYGARGSLAFGVWCWIST